ncbi:MULTISPECIES: helix-turn-helix transcriptional regulator [Streptomyces]|uniref:helix-turn-helix transcriptional regulator n=1 Tax=Streptomyces TaxID=1883 RepID=UPI0024C3A4BB|nr:helix-turn-helix transcriptional regulator [Streptomyces ardesiacus]
MQIERRSALASVEESLEESLSGRGQLVLASGVIAGGKTRLLAEISRHADESGALLLTATGVREEHDLDLAAICHMAANAPTAASALRKIVELADGNTPSGPGPVRPALDHLVPSVSALLLELARDTPVVIAVDDLHFLDQASLRVLLYLRRRLATTSMLLVLSEWDRPGLPKRPLHADLTRQPDRRIVLGPLSRAEVTHIAAGPGGPPMPAADVYALTGGNPLLTHALAADLRAGQAGGAASGSRTAAGPHYRQAVLDCVSRWDPQLMPVARAIAVLDEHAGPQLAAQLLDLQTEPVTEALWNLTAAGLLTHHRFRHREMATAVLESLPPEDASRLHTHAAELLYEQGAETLDVARHVIASGRVPGRWALRTLRHAADHALAAGDSELAVRCLELAMRNCEDERERRCYRMALIQVAWRVNPSAAARHLTPLQNALRAGELAPRDAVPLIRHLLWQGDRHTALQPMQAISRATSPADARAVAELKLSFDLIYGSRPTDPLHPAGDAPSPSSSGDQWTRALTAIEPLWPQGATEETIRSAEYILQGPLEDTLPEAGAVALLTLCSADQHKRAAFWSTSLYEEAVRRGATTWQAIIGCVRASLALQRGDLVAAEAQASAALDMLSPQSWGVLIGFPLTHLLLANTGMGRHDVAAGFLERVVPEEMHDTVFGLVYLHARGHYHLAVGLPLAAASDFEQCGVLAKARNIDNPSLAPWRNDLAQALLRQGQRKKARRLIEEQLRHPGGRLQPRTRGVSLRLLAAVGSPAERVPHLTESIALLEAADARLELARALADLSQAHREMGDLSQARLLARRADQEAKACHAEVLPTLHTTAVPERSHTRPADQQDGNSMTALSDAERKVAMLAALGHTNREIGHRLFITISTVEQHLTRIYRKLKVRKRTDLLAKIPQPYLSENSDVLDSPPALGERGRLHASSSH